MGIERKSKLLTKEAGVLPGSEFFIATEEHTHTDILQYLVMCGHYHCVTGYVIDRQSYDYLLVAYINEGTLRVQYDQRESVAQKGDVVVLDMKNPHYYAAVGHLEFTWLHIKGEASEKIYQRVYQQTNGIIKKGQTDEIYKKMLFILSSFQTEQPISTHALSVLLYDIMVHLLAGEPAAKQTNPGKVVATAIEYMKYNIGNAIDLSDIAAATHVSKYYFVRLFKKQMGCTPYNYLLKKRMNMAKHMLSTTQRTVRDIASMVGYQSEMGFVCAFTEKVGVPPGRYRRYPF